MRNILVIFRHPATAAFSIEASFDAMLEAFDGGADLRPRKFVSGHPSRGVLSRGRAMLELRRQRADVFHVSGDAHFLALALPGKRTVLTLHDLYFLGNARNAVSRWVLRKLWLDWPVAHCAAVTTVSENTRRAVLAATGCAPDKVRVVPTVVPRRFQPALRPFDKARPTFLHVGMGVNKNFERHVEALDGIPCRLLVVGTLNAVHRSLLERHGIDYECRVDLDAQQIVDAYAESDVVLFASLREGFGMPIVEAQAVGRVVVTSDLEPMRDVAGGAACLVDPTSVPSIRAGIRRVLDDDAWRESLVTRGLVNARRFAASDVARAYGDIYRDLIAPLDPIRV